MNRLVDAAVGAIPVAGDAFDAAWRANGRNVALPVARLADSAARRRDRRTVAVVGVAAFLAVLAVGAAGVLAAWWLLGAVGVA